MVNEKNNTKNFFILKSYMSAADEYLNITLAKLKRMKLNELKQVLKELKVPYYEVNLKDLNKKEIDDKGNNHNPIVRFINKTPEQKALIINISDSLKKKDFENLQKLKFFNEIDNEVILSNTLVILNEEKKNIIDNSINNLSSKNMKTKFSFIFEGIYYL